MAIGQTTAFKAAKFDVLIIENNPADARLTVEAFKEVGLYTGVLCLPSGDEALAYLRREDEHADKALPHIIFLDLHLPKTPGITVLAELKSNPDLKAIPVVVVTSSVDSTEIREAYELHANCVICKPAELSQFLMFIQTCYVFWAEVVTLPVL